MHFKKKINKFVPWYKLQVGCWHCNWSGTVGTKCLLHIYRLKWYTDLIEEQLPDLVWLMVEQGWSIQKYKNTVSYYVIFQVDGSHVAEVKDSRLKLWLSFWLLFSRFLHLLTKKYYNMIKSNKNLTPENKPSLKCRCRIFLPQKKPKLIHQLFIFVYFFLNR